MTKADEAMQADGQERKCHPDCIYQDNFFCGKAFAPHENISHVCGNAMHGDVCAHLEACHAPAAPLPATVTISLEDAEILSDALEDRLLSLNNLTIPEMAALDRLQAVIARARK